MSAVGDRGHKHVSMYSNYFILMNESERKSTVEKNQDRKEWTVKYIHTYIHTYTLRLLQEQVILCYYVVW
jgi:hypothetical protein